MDIDSKERPSRISLDQKISPAADEVETVPAPTHDDENHPTKETARVVDHVAERALCRRFDFRLMPVLAIMYLFNAYVHVHPRIPY